jgi:hypothetical protein
MKLFDPATTELSDDLTPAQIVEELRQLNFKRRDEMHPIAIDKGTRDFLVNVLRREK